MGPSALEKAADHYRRAVANYEEAEHEKNRLHAAYSASGEAAIQAKLAMDEAHAALCMVAQTNRI